jgi:hypothetical protein
MRWTNRQKLWFYAYKIVIVGLVLSSILFILREATLISDTNDIKFIKQLLGLFLTAGFWLCLIIGCWYACLGLNIWSESKRILTSFSSSERKILSVLCRISEANRVVYGSKPLILIPGIIGLFTAILMNEPRWAGLFFLALSLWWWLWVRSTTPPLVLFLSTSDFRSIEQHRQIKRLISPLRVVTLLDLSNSPSSSLTNELRLDCLRTGNDDDWWKVITVLIKITPLIVINADTESPGVVREALHLIAEDITFKTVFLTNGYAPLLHLEPELAASASGCFIASAAILKETIKTILDRSQLPSRTIVVKSFTKNLV